MTIGDAASVVALIVDLVALRFLIQIRNDDKVMRELAEESLQTQREYLSLRRRWYESRTKRKADEKTDLRTSDGVNPDNR
jgi:hypothetical protein